MILSHFSETKFKFDPAKKYNLSTSNSFVKPAGLWLSDESDYGWKKWCKDEDFGSERLRHETKFKINLENILVLDTSQKILNFTKKYKCNPLDKFGIGQKEGFNIFYINWEQVQKDYAGIIITPYQWDMRLDNRCFWYYTWDCASACIWDLTKLEKVNRARHIGKLSIEFRPGV